MAVEAVVDEVARAALQRLVVEAMSGRRRKAKVGAAATPAAPPANDTANSSEERGEALHPIVTRSGTGLVLSRAVYQGISRKNRK